MKNIIRVLDKDKRKRKRVEFFSNIQAQLEILGASSPATIKDVSYSGFGLIVPPNVNLSTMESLEAKLQIANQFFRTTIANKIILPDQNIKLGLSLPIQVQREINFNIQDASWDKVKDLETIKNIYDDLAFKGPENPIQIKQNFSIAVLIPMKITDSGTLICEIAEMQQGQLEKGKAKCMFNLFQTCHAFETNIEKVENNKVEIKLSNVVARLLRRETIRVRKKESTFEVSALLRNTLLGKEIAEFEVYDYSEHGLSLKDVHGDLSLPRNLFFDDVTVEIKNFGVIKGRGEIRSYEWNREQNAYVIGLLFQTDKEPHFTNWHNFILKSRYPNLDFQYRNEDHQRIWHLFEVSGFLEFKEEERFDEFRRISQITWEILEKAGSNFSKRILIREDDNIIGHMQMDKIYPEMWCPNHLAISSGVKSNLAKDLLTITPQIIAKSNAKYIINYTDMSNQWFKKNYYGFVKEYKDKEANYLREYQTYEVDIGADEFTFDTTESIKVQKANKFHMKSILNFYKKHYSNVEYDAFSLESDPFLEKMDEELKEVNLNRKREYLVALNGNELVGVATVETGTDAINVVGIVDICTINVFTTDETLAKQAQMNLMAESIEYYRKLNKRFIIFLVEEKYNDFTKCGLTFMCDCIRWICKKEVSSTFVSFINFSYGHLFLRREKIRKKIKGED